MANQVLLDEFKDLIETITLAIMEDIKASKLAEDMVVETVNLQVEAAAKKYQAIANESMADLEVLKKEILAEIKRRVGQEVRENITNGFKQHAEVLNKKLDYTKSEQEKQSDLLESMSKLQEEQGNLQKDILEKQLKQTEFNNMIATRQDAMLQLIKEMVRVQEQIRVQDLEAQVEQKAINDKRFKITVGLQVVSIVLCLAVLVVLVMNHGI